MSELKTKPTNASVTAFINAVENKDRRKDCRELSAMLRKITGKRPRMWGPSIIGYDVYRYKDKRGRQCEWPVIGYSPRKQNLTIYIMPGFEPYQALMEKLGKFTTGRSCLYVKSLDAIDRDVLQQLMSRAVSDMRQKYTG